MTEEEEYKAKKLADANLQTCKVCNVIGAKQWMDPHHPAGRSFGNMLNYFYVHRHCHQWIHDNPAEATAEGFLIEGRNTNSENEPR